MENLTSGHLRMRYFHKEINPFPEASGPGCCCPPDTKFSRQVGNPFVTIALVLLGFNDKFTLFECSFAQFEILPVWIIACNVK